MNSKIVVLDVVEDREGSMVSIDAIVMRVKKLTKHIDDEGFESILVPSIDHVRYRFIIRSCSMSDYSRDSS